MNPSTTHEGLLHAIARRGQTERETNPAILLASIPPDTSDHRCRATPKFKWGSLGRLISWPAHIIVRNKAVCKDAVCSLIDIAFAAETDNRHAALNRSTPTTVRCPLALASQSFSLDALGKSLQTE